MIEMETPHSDVEPTSLEALSHLRAPVAKAAGTVVGNPAFPANLKKRRGFSRAVVDSLEQIMAQVVYRPVRLEAMSCLVKAVLARDRLGPGDEAIASDPHLGDMHLPDRTMVTPIFSQTGNYIRAYRREES